MIFDVELTMCVIFKDLGVALLILFELRLFVGLYVGVYFILTRLGGSWFLGGFITSGRVLGLRLFIFGG